MRGLKPWHIILAIAAIVALPLSLYYQSSSQVDLAESIVLVDVTNGDLFRTPLPKGKAVIFPAINPLTKQAALFPAFEKDGKWFMETRHVSLIQSGVKGEPKALADPKSGELAISGTPTPKILDVF